MYFGIFKQLRELQLPNSYDYDLYEGYYSEFFEVLTIRSDYDIPFLLKQAHLKARSKKILELACGSGRILMHLANQGFVTVGMDLSNDMLELFRKKKDRIPSRISQKIEVKQGNMTDFHLDEKYPLIILSGTSISLLEETDDVERMLQTVYEHLEVGGRFVFDFVLSNELHNQGFREGRVQAVTLNINEEHKQFVLIGEEADENVKRAVMNFYAEVVDQGVTNRYFGSTRKRFFSEEELLACIDKTPFQLVETENFQLEGDNVKCYVLEKGVDL